MVEKTILEQRAANRPTKKLRSRGTTIEVGKPDEILNSTFKEKLTTSADRPHVGYEREFPKYLSSKGKTKGEN